MAASATSTAIQTQPARVTPTRTVRSRPAVHELARLVTGMFLVVPLGAAILDLGRPSLMLTLSGLAALHLAGELFLERTGHPISEDRSLRIVLVSWVAGLTVLGGAGWAGSVAGYHFESVIVVGVLAACFVGLVSRPPIAALWGVAATAAVALGASLVGPMTADAAMGAASVAAGILPGLIVGQGLERSVERRRRPLTFEP
ncbi:MAG TPA: hypothetical protein VK736_06295 [Candidatus Binatia bacterium]|nr:hypothetical protein [Candidatus Binatia bacterium]